MRDDAVRSLVRAAIVVGRAVFDRNEPQKVEAFVHQKGWADDRAAGMLTRAASAPATTSQAGWAAELAQVATAFFETLGPSSAAADLFGQALALDFGRAAQITLPHFVAGAASTAAFVAEGTPAPVPQLILSSPPPLLPHKLMCIALLSREMIESSNAEALVGDVLERSTGRVLDEVLFDGNPADDARPAGLRNGIAALTASTATIAQDAFLADIGALADAAAPIAGNGALVFIASPGRALTMRVRLGAADLAGKVSVLGSSAVINDLLCIVPAALVSAGGSDIRIEASREVEVHRANPAGVLVDGGAPSQPLISMFQTDNIAIRLRLPITWTLRDPAGFNWLTPSGW